MPQIRSTADIAEKFSRVTPMRTEDYKQGIENPKKDWEAETFKAEGAYKEGIAAAIARGAFGKGVKEAGSAKWKENTLAKGVDRWGPGVSMAGPSYEKGFAPYRDTIERTNLPPRYAKGDPRNFERVKAIGLALHKKKISG